jgi:hypothetical protein
MRIAVWILGLVALVVAPAICPADDFVPPPPVVESSGPLDGVLPACPPLNPHAYTVDVLFGLPTGFRVQRSVDDDQRWHLEGIAGLELIFPMVGGGIRRRYEPFCSKHDALVVAPGLDAYLLYNPLHDETGFIIGGGPEWGFAVTADFDMMWRHSFTERCQSELGFKLGAGVGYAARWGVLPVGGVFTGIRW